MTGIERIAAERLRQIEQEGFTAEHDESTNRAAELAWAACYYAMPEQVEFVDTKRGDQLLATFQPAVFYPEPWPIGWAKRGSKDRIGQLVAAGALIAAEIDRLLAIENKGGQ